MSCQLNLVLWNFWASSKRDQKLLTQCLRLRIEAKLFSSLKSIKKACSQVRFLVDRKQNHKNRKKTQRKANFPSQNLSLNKQIDTKVIKGSFFILFPSLLSLSSTPRRRGKKKSFNEEYSLMLTRRYVDLIQLMLEHPFSFFFQHYATITSV